MSAPLVADLGPVLTIVVDDGVAVAYRVPSAGPHPVGRPRRTVSIIANIILAGGHVMAALAAGSPVLRISAGRWAVVEVIGIGVSHARLIPAILTSTVPIASSWTGWIRNACLTARTKGPDRA